MRVPAHDPCAGRHRDNPESTAAFRRLAPIRRKQAQRVLDAVLAAGADGLTCRELAERWGKGMNAISGRFSELKACEPPLIRRVYRDGRPVTRAGCGVYRGV